MGHYSIHDISDIPDATWELLDRLGNQQMTANAAWEVRRFCDAIRQAISRHIDSNAANHKSEGAANGVY